MLSSAQATIISGVEATSSSGNHQAGTEVKNIVNGSGLSSYSLDATHAVPSLSPGNAWTSETIESVLTFDLKGTYTLTGMSVWNFNNTNSIGINEVSISTSLDGTTFNVLGGAPTNFEKGALNAIENAQQFSWNAIDASYVKFEIASNHGHEGAVGLSEVVFDSVNPVPEPATMLLFGIGLLGLAGVNRRK